MRRRRPHRCCAVKTLASRGASALQAWLWLLVFIFQNEFRISDSIQPGYLDFDNLPDTNFTCAGKVIGGYYADLETSCQMFHVCTVGQADEPMDIKFLCLNGTVFDQETRVCERVDEVDCTKSETFYSLNLELYGSTVAPAAADTKHNQSQEQSHDRSPDRKTEPTTSSAQPDPSPDPPRDQSHNEHRTEHVEPVEENQEPEEEVQEEDEYEDYTSSAPTTLPPSPPTTTPPPATTTAAPPPSTAPPAPTYGVPSDPTLLSPHQFTYQHAQPSPAAGAAPPALSFQRQSYPHAQPPRLTLTAHRPADRVYITAAPPYSELEQIDQYELYESAKSVPRLPHDRPAPFLPPHASRAPQGFRPAATVAPPRSQLQSPGQYDPRQSYQPSERHEILYEERFRPPPPPVPTYEYDRFHYDRKRSHDTEPSTTRVPPLARSAAPAATATVAPTTGETPTTRPTPRAIPKSPPRVIVTASASVSDSNGKKLNYTVGNVVRAVKPIVAINYDDYKESDLIFDPFFLDVPKLVRRRKMVGDAGHDLGKRSAVITLQQAVVAPLAAPPAPPPSPPPAPVTVATPAWLPPDYVDDNYEPSAYVEAPPPQRDEPPKEKPPKKPPREKESEKVVPKVVVSSQSPAAERKGVGGKEARRPSAAVRPLLAALPPPGGGSYRLVRAGPGGHVCKGRKPYEVFADARDCAVFHLCAGAGVHVELRCARGLHYAAGACTRPARGEPPPSCLTPLGTV